jgi:hydroxymethylpyrimidine pyrophosphatase-like HAD family hydrolase
MFKTYFLLDLEPIMSANNGTQAIAAITSPQAASILAQVTHIYTDLDGTLFAPGGTLLATNDRSPSLATATALVALRQAGIEVAIVTGRNRSQGNEIMRILNIDLFIAEMGCLVMRGYGPGGKVSLALGDWEHTQLAPGLAPGELPANTTPLQLMERTGVVDRLLAAFAGKLEFHNPYKVTREVTLTLRGFVDADKIVAHLATEALPLQLIDNGVIHPAGHTLVDCPEVHAYHLMPRGAGKAAAVAADMELRGLEPAQCLAIGDAVGDVAMGSHTGSMVVVGNALKSGVVETAARHCPNPVFATTGYTADGWAEFAQAVLAAKARDIH